MEADKVSIIHLISGPLFAIFLAFFLLKEIPTSNVLIGGTILLLSGLYLKIGKN